MTNWDACSEWQSRGSNPKGASGRKPAADVSVGEVSTEQVRAFKGLQGGVRQVRPVCDAAGDSVVRQREDSQCLPLHAPLTPHPRPWCKWNKIKRPISSTTTEV